MLFGRGRRCGSGGGDGNPVWLLSDWLSLGCFYRFSRSALMVGLEEVWSLQMVGWFPCVVAFGVSFPLYEIL